MIDTVTTRYEANGSSAVGDSLGMREMQRRVYAKRTSKYLLVKAPPACGKSRALMYVGLDKLRVQGLRKAIVAVPEKTIGASFDTTDLVSGGYHWSWTVPPGMNLCADGSDKTGAFRDFLSSDEEILVCSHATLRNAHRVLGTEAFAGCFVGIDEFHHASADSGNKLGETCRALVASGSVHIMAMTGSYFRGDGAMVLRPEDEEVFDRVTYTYYEQLNGYRHLKTLGVGFHFYEGSYLDHVAEVLDPGKKTIVYVPMPNAAESTGDKYVEVGRIMDVIGTRQGSDPATGFVSLLRDGRTIKVADLVTEDGREVVLEALRKPGTDVDVIVALAMAKEGFDWVHCEHVVAVGYRSSMVETVQILGRATRDCPGKSHAQYTNLVALPAADRPRVTGAVNDVLKAITCSLLMEQVLAPDFDFKTKQATSDVRPAPTPRPGPGAPVGPVRIEIKGFREASTPRTRQIVEEDINDIKAALLQDDGIVRAAVGGDADAPSLINKQLVPKVISTMYPTLSRDEVEEVRQHVVADTLFKSSAVRTGIPGALPPELRLSDLHVDLIDRVNVFGANFSVLSRDVDADVLRQVHEAVVAARGGMTSDEALHLYPRVGEFHKRHDRMPSLVGSEPGERRLAEAVALLRKLAAERKAKSGC